MRRSEFGDRAVLLAPGGRGKADMRAGIQRIVRHHVFRDDEALEPTEASAHGVGPRQADRRVRAQNPEPLDLALGDGIEHRDSFQPFARRHAGRVPEAADAIDIGRGEAHMGRELVGEAADLAAPHCIGLARQRKRAGAKLADAARRQMAVENGDDLVRALHRLIDTLAVERHDARRRREKFEEATHVSSEGRCVRSAVAAIIGRQRPRIGQRLRKAARMGGYEGMIEGAAIGEIDQQPAEQRSVLPRRNRQMQRGRFGRRGDPRIDIDQRRAARLLRLHHALIENRMTPGGIRTDEHEEIGFLQVIVAAGYRVGAENPLVAGHRRGHAEP